MSTLRIFYLLAAVTVAISGSMGAIVMSAVIDLPLSTEVFE